MKPWWLPCVALFDSRARPLRPALSTLRELRGGGDFLRQIYVVISAVWCRLSHAVAPRSCANRSPRRIAASPSVSPPSFFSTCLPCWTSARPEEPGARMLGRKPRLSGGCKRAGRLAGRSVERRSMLAGRPRGRQLRGRNDNAVFLVPRQTDRCFESVENPSRSKAD